MDSSFRKILLKLDLIGHWGGVVGDRFQHIRYGLLVASGNEKIQIDIVFEHQKYRIFPTPCPAALFLYFPIVLFFPLSTQNFRQPSMWAWSLPNDLQVLCTANGNLESVHWEGEEFKRTIILWEA